MRSLVFGTALVGLVSLLGACGTAVPSPSSTAPSPSPTAAPDFVQFIKGPEGTVRRLVIYDSLGVLVGVARLETLGGLEIHDPYIVWEPIAGEPSSLVLGWLGGVCGADPRLSITSEGGRTTLDVYDGDPISLPSGASCPAVGVEYGVKLTFEANVDSYAFALHLTDTVINP